MFKLYAYEVFITMSLDVLKIYEHIISDPDNEFVIIKDFTEVKNEDFARLFLYISKDYDKYALLESILNNTKSIYDTVEDITNLTR